MKRKIEVGTAIFLMMACTILACLITYTFITNKMKTSFAISEKYAKLSQVEQVVAARYIDEYDEGKTMDGILSGFVTSVDSYGKYLDAAAYQQYQSTGNAMYQAYAQYYQQMYESYSQNDMNFQMLVVGAHPITYTETAGVSVKPLLTTSDKGYLSTDATAAKHTLAVTATVTNGDNVGAVVWYGYAGSFEENLLDKTYGYNDEFLYAALDWAGGTAVYQSPHASIKAIDVGSTVDMAPGWMIGIAAFAIIVLPLAVIVTGIVVVVKRKRK